MRNHARAVVIGGGIMGCSLLYHLTRLGWYDCVLVEQSVLAAGPTRYSAGMCTHFAPNSTIMQMRANSIRLYRSELPQENGQPDVFRACGAFRVTREPDRMDEFRHVKGIGRSAGIDFHIVDPVELKKLHPFADTGGLIGAVYAPLDGYVDPGQAALALAGVARVGGAEVLERTSVRKIARTPEGEWRVYTNRGEIVAEIIVNAAGTGCRDIGAMTGLDLPVVPMLQQYLVLDRVGELCAMDRELPIIGDPDERWYLRLERDGVIIGPYQRDGMPWTVDGESPKHGTKLPTPDLGRVKDIVARALAGVPAAADAGITTIVNGPVTFTPDANPLVGPAFGTRNAYLLTGSSMGAMEGGGAGKFLAEWIVGGEPPMDPLVVDPRRFGAWADREYCLARAIESFGAQFAIRYPFGEQQAGRPKRKTPIYHDLKAGGAVFGSVGGWERPDWFAGDGVRRGIPGFRQPEWFDAVRQECECVRDNVAVTDLGMLSKFEIRGRHAFEFVDQLGANRAPRNDGGITLTHSLNPGGGVVAEFMLTRISESRFLLTSAPAAERQNEDLLNILGAGFASLEIENTTHRTGVLGVMGPESRTLLTGLTDAELDSGGFPWFTAREIEIAGIAVTALRVSSVGELGWELHVPVRHMRKLYGALVDHGAQFDMGHYGAQAMNALRLENGYRAWGVDLTTERTPLESGLSRIVKPENREFAGRKSLLTRERDPERRTMHLIELEERGLDPFYAHLVLEGDEAVGMVTSGAYGHGVNKPLALAYFNINSTDSPCLDTLVLGERVPTRILERAPHDPDNIRMKS